jgi:hypothetical protein
VPDVPDGLPDLSGLLDLDEPLPGVIPDGLAGLLASAPDSLPQAGRPLRPLAPPAPGTFAARAEQEMSALEAGIKKRKKAERDRFQAATDSEYWFAVCFQSRAEKETFLRAAGLWEHGDKYLDGRVVADTLGIDVGGSHQQAY